MNFNLAQGALCPTVHKSVCFSVTLSLCKSFSLSTFSFSLTPCDVIEVYQVTLRTLGTNEQWNELPILFYFSFQNRSRYILFFSLFLICFPFFVFSFSLFLILSSFFFFFSLSFFLLCQFSFWFFSSTVCFLKTSATKEIHCGSAQAEIGL